MLVLLAVIPAVILLVYIYKKDRVEKEPAKLLWKCFFFGVLSTLAAIGLEEIGEELFESDLVYGSIEYAFVDGVIVTALAEELCKYLALKLKTWRSKELNCTFDGIVYSVFVAMGFAAFENIFYVLDGGIGDAILRMFTAVPGHACDGVAMGYFYSRAKKAQLEGNKPLMRKNRLLALLVPIVLHGLYDALLSMESDVVGDSTTTISIVLWFALVIATFVLSFKLVNKASKEDAYYIPELEPAAEEQE